MGAPGLAIVILSFFFFFGQLEGAGEAELWGEGPQQGGGGSPGERGGAEFEV